MTTDEFVKKIDFQLDRIGKKRADMLRDLDFPSSTISNWIARNSIPSLNVVTKIAYYFGLTIDDFLNMEKPALDDDIENAVNKLMSLTKEQRRPIIDLINSQVEYWRQFYNSDKK